jgi:hypothetical protein
VASSPAWQTQWIEIQLSEKYGGDDRKEGKKDERERKNRKLR